MLVLILISLEFCSYFVYCMLKDYSSNVNLFLSVFDDGDENTLRRTQLCLKGEKHFVKSEVR